MTNYKARRKWLALAFLAMMIAFGFLLPIAAQAHVESEDHYNRAWCLANGGRVEVHSPIDGTFTDCMTLGYAIEADFVRGKWYEAIGQAGHYAQLWDRLPGILLIVDTWHDCRVLPAALASIASRSIKLGGREYGYRVWLTGTPEMCDAEADV